MMQQTELGYRPAADLVDVEYDSVVLDEEINGGRVVVMADARVIYLCTDALAWGTLTEFATLDEAQAFAAGMLDNLRDTLIDLDEVSRDYPD